MQPSTAKDIRNKLFICRMIRAELYFTAISLEEDNFFLTEYNIYPPFPSQKCFVFYCSCEGLFCFENEDEREIVLSNPTTNEFKILPKLPELPRGVSNYSMSAQIWFDHKSEDYKVMFLVMADFEDEEGDCLDVSYQIDLYSLKANSWKRIPCTGFSYCAPPGACINGVFYCEAYREGESTPVILSFDLSTETISSLPLPDFSKHPFFIREYNGLLSIFACSRRGIDYSFELWVMNESWARESIFHTSGVCGPLSFWKRGELLCFQSVNHELLVFDRVTGKLKHLDISSTPHRIDLFPFVETTVQLKGGSDQVVESSVQLKGGSELEANMWLGNLLHDMYRMKGLLSVDGMDERFVFQGVHDIFQGSPDRLWGADEARVNKLVFIGKNLDPKEPEEGFKKYSTRSLPTPRRVWRISCMDFGPILNDFDEFQILLASARWNITIGGTGKKLNPATA
ncbi:plastid transcriptionally active 17 [Perilla frutescens var. hirtella]|nr:plastid transcriptionally active 17 [Perilla frutescens var. hirtella]